MAESSGVPNGNALAVSEKRKTIATTNTAAATGGEPGAVKAEKERNGRPSPPQDELLLQANPPDFEGEVETNNGLPSMQVLRSIENYPVMDHAGKTHPFKSLYSGHNVARRILIIFVRHFFCGNCQEYLRTLSASITPEALLGLPVSTFIAVVGCGSHELIGAYVRETGCAFPVYADPTQRLYRELGMVRTLSLGPRPAYLQNKTVAHTVVSGIFQGLRQVRAGLATKMGDQRQVGGEFLFEPASRSLDTPIATPVFETPPPPPPLTEKAEGDGEGRAPSVEEKCVTWCHRMRTTRDHAELPELMEVLGLEGNGAPARDARRWQKALTARKGTGLSMAAQMGRMSVDTTGTR
ncbi:putative thioredoxin-like protein AAED1 [Rosellinia necatrix]|uniref:Putative thioredoxin-like protein AAED1 n=1 Tax=Rosellinia necatrix TaxID=77044 RepID=A0A1W2TRS1_ROSNE|nr:putative thioredoxin-like protein AAED1 [Rosellinia necatrix]